MSTEVMHSPPTIEWGVASRALAGEVESGDRHLVQPFSDGLLVAVVDGIGHGPEAAHAARSAVGILEGYARETLGSLVSRCHHGLLQTRGVVMSLASFHWPDETMTWLGVGNVEGLLVRAEATGRPRSASLLLRGGVVGAHLPRLQPSVHPLTRGDTLIFATDGIDRGFDQEPIKREPPQQIADRVLARYGKETDDALVLVARYLGGAA